MPYLTGYVTPQDYGAAGNGTTDDTAAVQAAINAVSAAGGGVVFFPTGTYLVTPTSSPALTVPSNIRLLGANRKSATLKKNANGVMISMSGPSSDTTGATHVKYSSIEQLGLNGNSKTGLLLQLYYADDLTFRDVFMTSNADICIDTAEFWDSRFYNLSIESSGGAANAVAPNVMLRNSAATTGFGYSSDNVNQIHFVGCRFEAFYTGAVSVNQGVNSTNNPNGIYLTDCKMETSQMRGGPHLKVDSSCHGVYANHLYLYAGNFASGYSTAQNMIVWSGQNSTLENVLISNSSTATINSGVDLFSGAATTAVVRNVTGTYGTAPTGTHIFFESSSTADFRIDNCYSSAGGTFSGTIPTANYQSPALRLIAGAVSDSSFSHGPMDGILAIDSTDSKLYARIGGAWKAVTLS